MKFVLLILSVLLCVSCTSVSTSNDADSSLHTSKEASLEKTEADNLLDAITLARKNNDYRLLVTSGRSMSIPGVKASNYEAMIKRCGKKYSPNAGDVITSEDQRLARKKLVDFMRYYNEKMLIICQENTAG